MGTKLSLAVLICLCLTGSALALECGVSTRKNCDEECAGRQVLGCERYGYMLERCKCGDPLPDKTEQAPAVDPKAECLTQCRKDRLTRNQNCPPGDYQDMTRQFCLENSKNEFGACVEKCNK